jgi:putative peptidoglycan lipid II flippase
MVVNAVVAVGLAPVIGWIAPAIATTLAAWVMVALLYKGTRPMGYVAKFDERLRQRLPRICLASAIMGGTLWAMTITLGPALGTEGWRYLALTILILGGVVAYFLSGHVLGAFKLSDFRRAARRG